MHIIMNIMLPLAACAAIANHVKSEVIERNVDSLLITTDIVSLLVGAIDATQYRRNGSLSLPYGAKKCDYGTSVNWIDREYAIAGQHYFLTIADTFSINDLNLAAYHIEASTYSNTPADSEFVEKALQHVDRIADYTPLVWDIAASSLRGSTMYVKRYAPSMCSMCKRVHDNDNTMFLIFNSEAKVARWKCIRATEIKSIVFYEEDTYEAAFAKRFESRESGTIKLALAPTHKKSLLPSSSLLPLAENNSDDEVESYSTDYEQMLVDHARLLYERKCRDGQYIKNIDRLIKRSLGNSIRRDLTAKVRVYVIVEATVIRYDENDFVTGMVVQKIIPAGKINDFDMLECRNDHVVALMQLRKGAHQFAVGESIPLRVGSSICDIGSDRILINGIPFIPIAPDAVQVTVGKLTAESKKYFDVMIKPLLKRELERKAKLDVIQWNSFNKLLCPYKTGAPETGTVDLMDVDAIYGTLGINYRADMAQLKLSSKVAPKSEAPIVLLEESRIALTRLAFPFVKQLSVVNDLTEQYPPEESSKVEHVWKMYSHNKL
ncbi:hypothetical protein PHYBOEH_005575 [Phytophthora boehmeriae]|uniref:Uncharacterized protein n=1 Tax=Phytophthora boehmeriae TaxID=109152 RepID=A0A8T1WLW5_9STRA|nr:hypothetical protein PHYBOEH_005575 [Phytophthora boehmeriae]